MKTVSIKFVAKPNGMSTIYLVYSKAITLPDGSRKKSESLKIEIYTIPKNTKEKKYNDKILEVAEYVRCNRQLEVIRGVHGLKNIDKM